MSVTGSENLTNFLVYPTNVCSHVRVQQLIFASLLVECRICLWVITIEKLE